MLQVPQIEDIRRLWEMGSNVKRIADEMHIDRKTVRKYLDMDDFNDEARHVAKGSKLDPYKAEIGSLIDDESIRFHKQRWTAVRMQEYLVKDRGYKELADSYHLIRRYMKWYRFQKMRAAEAAPGTMALVWHPGEAQADFGEADFETDGGKARMKYLVMSFPYSNRLVCVVMPGENCECVCQGLRYFFDFLGGVPRMILFDNATGIGRRVFGGMQESELFVRFRMQYGFHARYANIESGWEKGCVESAVGTFRRNRMVPPLRISGPVADWDVGTMLPLSFAFRADAVHYRKGKPVEDLFAEDRTAMLPLPRKPFEVVRIDSMALNGEGTALVDKTHRYTLGPSHSREQVIVRKRAWTVSFRTMGDVPITEFPRQYGSECTEDYDIEAMLHALAYKPNAWPNSPVRDAMEAGGFRDYLDESCPKDRTHALYMFGETSDEFGFPMTSYVLNRLCRDGKVPSREDVEVMCNRFVSFPFDESENCTGVGLSKYDALMAVDGGCTHAV
ncbi:MAG: IS21 family transposase [Sphaerochaetaceae bacterium]